MESARWAVKRLVEIVVLGLLVVGALAVAVGVFLAGDSGSRAVWEL